MKVIFYLFRDRILKTVKQKLKFPERHFAPAVYWDSLSRVRYKEKSSEKAELTGVSEQSLPVKRFGYKTLNFNVAGGPISRFSSVCQGCIRLINALAQAKSGVQNQYLPPQHEEALHHQPSPHPRPWINQCAYPQMR